jgi:hypothetical protein
VPTATELAAARRDPRLLAALAQRGADPNWRVRGRCRSGDPELFFPGHREPSTAAVELCRRCEVQGPCLAWALQVGDDHGVWGATTPRERRILQVVWREAQVVTC